MKKNALLLAALALAACSPDFDPASKIDKLRVLAVKAEPPEIAPGASAKLETLVVRADFASDPTRTTTLVYLACLPAPGDLVPTPCVALASLADPTAALAAAAEASCSAPPAQGSVPPVAFAGAEECGPKGAACTPVQLAGTPLPPALAVPASYGFDAPPPTGSAEQLRQDRILGVQAVVLVFALEATADEIFAGATGPCPLASAAASFSSLWSSPEREHVLSVKRVLIRGPEAPDAPNLNPSFDGISAGGADLAAASATSLPARDVDLAPIGVEASLVQPYTELDAAGAPIQTKTEEWVYSWFSTAGEMEDLHTRAPDPLERWKLTSSDAAPALVAAVVRDLRGGVAWQVREVALQP